MSQEATIDPQEQRPASADRIAHPLEITYRPIDELKLDPKSARKHTGKKLGQLAASLQTFGFVTPALIDADDRVIAGNARIQAARQLGRTEIPTIRLEHLSEAKRRALTIADNRLAECASWDKRLLAEQRQHLCSVELDFDIEVTGFEVSEIELKIAGLEGPPGADPADRVPEPSTTAPITRDGDIWLLGGHRVLCGNAVYRAALQRLMGDERAAMVFTEPRSEGPVTGLGRTDHRSFGMAGAEPGSAALCGPLALSLRNQAASCRGGALLYVAVSGDRIPELLGPGQYADLALEGLCVWVKDRAGAGSLYRPQHQPIFVFRTRDDEGETKLCLARPGRDRTDVWRYPAVKPPRRKGRKSGEPRPQHEAKPVALVADAILDATARGEIVLDGCLGSGTTLIAAERTERRCFGVEADPVAVDALIRRWQNLTGGRARHADTGAGFDDLIHTMELADAA